MAAKESENTVDALQAGINRDADASQTAADYIDEQLALEADAKEILPYKFDKCTYPLGPLRQSLYACLTCSPPPASPAQLWNPAGVCYACSISCHGDHNLVELFTRRNFVCDCGTKRLSSPCTLRADPNSGERRVTGQEPGEGNSYNHNFQNRFCGCGQEYDAETEKGTMYQCLGLGTPQTGGCGEDWWHPHCLMGLKSDWLSQVEKAKADAPPHEDQLGGELEEAPVPDGFPSGDDFDHLICYKCVDSNPWIKSYAGTTEFLPPLFKSSVQAQPENAILSNTPSLKRKASSEDQPSRSQSPSKRLREENGVADPLPTSPALDSTLNTDAKYKHDKLEAPPQGVFSLLLKKEFREQLCHCPKCFPNLIPHPQLREEEDEYEPSISDTEQSLINGSGARSHGTGSLLDRGEAALSTMDRVKAIEGVMVYNHLKDKVKEFLKPYADSGRTVAAEDIKAYFEKLRGDEAGIKEAGKRPTMDSDDDGNDTGNRRPQSGY